MTKNLDNKLKAIFISSAEQKVLDYLVSKDGYQEVKEIKRVTNLSKAGVHLALKNLQALNLIVRDQKGKTYLYQARNYSFLIKQFKVFKTIIHFATLIKKLKPFSQKVVLFGSVSKGEDTEKSDFDFLIISRNEDTVRKIIEKFGDYKIQAIIKSPQEILALQEKDIVFFREADKGIVLWDKSLAEGEDYEF